MADYAETLLPALRKTARPGVSVEADAAMADLHIYHLGNNRLHAAIYARASATPGIVVLHDSVLNHYLLGALTRDQYVEEFVYNYGEWNRHVGEDLWEGRAACQTDPRYFQYPMLRRAIENARAVIVHNPGAAAIAGRHGGRNITIVPHFYEPTELPDAFETVRFRERLGIGPGVTLFGIFGYLRETKRIMACIKAFRRLNAVRPATALLIAGDVVSQDLSRLLANEAPHPAIHRMGHLAEAEFRIAASSVECCLNLRYPAAGETSGISIRLMGAGKPVIVTEGEETADLPEAVCLRVPAGLAEAEALFNQMAFVVEFPALARRVGEAAQQNIRSRHSLYGAAEAYWQVVDSIAPKVR